jgi:hypothetical protein
MFCTHCGSRFSDAARYCESCGRELHKPAAVNTQPMVAPVPIESAMVATVQAPSFRGASLAEIATIKTLSASDWRNIAAAFNANRDETSVVGYIFCSLAVTAAAWWASPLFPVSARFAAFIVALVVGNSFLWLWPGIQNLVSHKAAWDGYFDGYRDGLEEGVNRALDISEQQAAHIEDILLQREIHSTPTRTERGSRPRELEAAVRRASVRANTASTVEQRVRPQSRAVNWVGATIFGIGVGGGIGVFLTAADVQHALPNVGNMLLFAAFGLATYLNKAVALTLGLAYLGLLVFMTVAHGFTPLEILQCLALAGFLLYIQQQRRPSRR